MAPRPEKLFSPDQASSFLESSTLIKTALRQFEQATIGGLDTLSVFEIVEVVIDILLYFADFISQPHYDFPRVNLEIQAGETITDPHDQARLGTVDSKKRNPRPRTFLGGSKPWQDWAWRIIQVLLDLKKDPTMTPEGPGSNSTAGPVSRGERVAPTLAALLRRERRRRKKEQST